MIPTAATFVLCGLIALPAAVDPERQDGPSEFGGLPADVVTALQKNEAALSTVSLTYVITKEGERPPEGALPQDYGGPSQCTISLDSHRVYQQCMRQIRSPEGDVEESERERSFDGTVLYVGEPQIRSGTTPAVLTKFLPEDESDPERNAALLSSPYLEAAGVYIPESPSSFSKWTRTSLVLHYAQIGRVKDVSGGSESALRISFEVDDPVILRARSMDLDRHRKMLESGRNTPDMIRQEMATLEERRSKPPVRMIKFVLDPSRGYCVLEREEFNARGQRLMHCVCGDITPHRDSTVWLPAKTSTTYFTFPGSVESVRDRALLVVEANLSEVAFKVPDNVAFKLDYRKPGTLVVDRTTPEARERDEHSVSYVVAASPEDLRRAAQEARDDLGGSRRTGPWIYLLIANIVVIVVVALFILVRRFW